MQLTAYVVGALEFLPRLQSFIELFEQCLLFLQRHEEQVNAYCWKYFTAECPVVFADFRFKVPRCIPQSLFGARSRRPNCT